MSKIKFYAEFRTSITWKSDGDYSTFLDMIRGMIDRDDSEIKLTICINISDSTISILSQSKLTKKEIIGVVLLPFITEYRSQGI